MKLKKLGVRNIRSFKEKTILDIKPMTILVGKNSSGKSTIARLFPLLRQSIETKTKGPILWYGDYIDFGSFETTRTIGSTDPSLGIYLELELAKNDQAPSWFLPENTPMAFQVRQNISIKIHLSLAFNISDNTTYTEGVTIEFAGNIVDMKFDAVGWVKKFTINNIDAPTNPNQAGVRSDGDFLPTLNFFSWIEKDGKKSWDYAPEIFSSKIYDFVKTKTYKKLTKTTLSPLIAKFGLAEDELLLERMKSTAYKSARLSLFCKSLDIDSNNFRQLKALYFFENINKLLGLLNHNVKLMFSDVKYIKPLRANAQRYYRYQELSVDEIDSDGANIAMFLESLTYSARNSLNEWLTKKIGITVEPQRSEGHLILKITDRASPTPMNIADMGFGYSQILPILVQTWASINLTGRHTSIKKIKTTALVIEQPELHLHPEFQAKLADIFVELISDDSFPIIIETHSPHIINRFGELIAKGAVSAEHVGVFLIEDQSDGSKILPSTFNKEGYLENWPFGFFEPGLDSVSSTN